MERDPVCGMNVDPDKAAARVDHAGKTYYFCAPGCAKRFQQAPETYLSNSEKLMARTGLVNLQAPAQSSRAVAGVGPPLPDVEHSPRHLAASHRAHGNADVSKVSKTPPGPSNTRQ